MINTIKVYKLLTVEIIEMGIYLIHALHYLNQIFNYYLYSSFIGSLNDATNICLH